MKTGLLEKPIIFIGTGRSGTTIISEAIMNHRDLAWPSNYQQYFPHNLKINYLRRITDNNYLRLIGNKRQLYNTNLINKILFKPCECYTMWQQLVGNDIDFSRGFLLYERLGEKRKLFIQKYFEKLVKYQGKKRFSFKITGPPRMCFLLNLFPDAQFVILRRKLIPTINSFLKVPFWESRGKNKLWWEGAYSDNEIRFVERIKNQPELITALQLKKIRWAEDFEMSKCKPEYIIVNYEDFVNNPQTEINRLLKFLNLTPDEQINKYIEKNPIINRNKIDKEYFDKEILEKVNNVINNEVF